MQEIHKRHGFNPWVGKILWRRKWEPTPVCLPGESHGRRILVGYSSWGCRVRNNLASKQTTAAAEWVHVLLTRFFEVKLEHLASISFSQCWSKIILISHCVCNRVLVSVLKWKGIFLSLSWILKSFSLYAILKSAFSCPCDGLTPSVTSLHKAFAWFFHK